MGGWFLFLHAFLLGICLCPLSSLPIQTWSYEALPTIHLNEGVLKKPPGGKRLLLQVKELQEVKVEAEKEREVKQNGHKQDATVANSETGASLGKELPAGSGHDNATKNDTKPGDEETKSSSIPPPPPPPPPSIDKGDVTPLPENKTDVLHPVPNVDKVNDTSSDMDPQKPALNCGGSHCEDPKILMSACLSIPEDGAHKLSLLITYEGGVSVVVKVTAPEFLKADPLEVSVSKGKSETIHFSMDSKYEDTLMYLETMQNKTIVVTTPHGHCEIDVPTEYLLNSVEERVSPFFIRSVEPRVIAYLLMFVVFISCVGAWLCYKCRGKKRAGDVKYQQIEMNGAGPSTPKERVEEAGDGWDEVWDDDWEDTEAAKSSSRLNQSLSSRGLAARRGAKDGRDNGWDD